MRIAPVTLILAVLAVLGLADGRVCAQVPYHFDYDGDTEFMQAVGGERTEPYIRIWYPTGGGSHTETLPWTEGFAIGTDNAVEVPSYLVDDGDSGVRYRFSHWSDGETNPYRVFEVEDTEELFYMAHYVTEYRLTMNVDIDIQQTGGEPVTDCGTTPGTSWYDKDSVVAISTCQPDAYTEDVWEYLGWIGSGNGSYTGDELTHDVTMNEPLEQTAHWYYEWHVYDQPFNYSWTDEGVCAPVDDCDARVDEGNGMMELRAEISGKWPFVGSGETQMGCILSERNGNFRIRGLVDFEGDPPHYMRWGNGTRHANMYMRVVNLEKNEVRYQDRKRKFGQDPIDYSKWFGTKLNLEDDPFGVYFWIDFYVAVHRYPPWAQDDLEWDFWGGWGITVEYIEVLPVDEKGADEGAAAVLEDCYIRIPNQSRVDDYPTARILPGESCQFEVELTPLFGFSDPCTLYVDELPENAVYEFATATPAWLPAGVAGTTVTITTAPDTPENFYLPVVYGVAGQDTTNVVSMALRVGLDGPGEDRAGQDGFPNSGTLDLATLGTNSVRFDMAADISPPGQYTNEPGDSLVFVLPSSPRLVYRLRENELFDPFRTSGLPAAGWVDGDSTRAADGRSIPNRWTFDLPDSNFLFPGDVIHYYVEWGGSEPGMIPADTTGFSLFPGDEGYNPLQYPDPYVVRALPTLVSATPGDQPPVLFWNDSGACGDAAHWYTSLAHLGYLEGVDYDVYYTNQPDQGLGDGLGGRATATQLAGYQTILYTAGDLSRYTLSNGDDAHDAGQDIAVLDAWLQLRYRNLLLAGNNVASDLSAAGTEGTMFLDAWLGITVLGDDVGPYIDNQYAPQVAAVSPNAVFPAGTEWSAAADEARSVYYDAVTVHGTGQRLAEFTAEGGATGVYPYAAASLNEVTEFDAKVVYLPTALMNIRTPAKTPIRTEVLDAILTYFGHAGSGPPSEVPPRQEFSISCKPNPFNPQTRISYCLPRRGRLVLRIYDVRGGLVTTLLDEVLEAGPGAVGWDGTDDQGARVSSGVYFYRAVAPERAIVGKVTLIK